ncbi:MAG: glycosyltransferase family 1 protein [Candidatus Dormiibacterota bacterium]
MEIGIDASRAFQSEATGIGVYATEVLARLLPQPPAPLRLYLNQRIPPRSAPELAPGSEWRCLPLARGWTKFRLRWEVQRHPPQLLWIPAYRLPPGRLPRSVVTVHGVEHRFAPAAYPGGDAEAVESFVTDTLARAARVITPSETTKADLVHLYGAEPNRITVIPHGIAAALQPIPADRLPALIEELGSGPPYFLVVGAHHPRKNVVFLMDQFARAFPPGRSPEVRLVVTNATGPVGATLRAQAARLELGHRVQLLGHVSGERLAALYSGAVAACVPSLYEGFGLPALEAMACATPVLANGVGGVEEVAQGAALLISPGDAEGWVDGLRRLLQEPDWRQHLSGLGLSRAARYSWDQSARSHRQLLAEELRLAQASAPA